MYARAGPSLVTLVMPTTALMRRRIAKLFMAIVAIGWLAIGVPCVGAESRLDEIPAWLKPGAPLKLRIEGPGESRSLTGFYVRHDSTTLHLRTNSTMPSESLDIHREWIVRFEVSQERASQAWKGYGLGVLVVGAVATAALLARDDIDGAGALALGVGFYGSLGGLVGSLVGGSYPKDRWVLIWDHSRGGM